jgi:uncharacterized membrane protein YcaP (DUF421 family)
LFRFFQQKIMKKEEIHLGDLQRILLGSAPAHFLLEVLLRSVIIYVVTLLVMRWLGKRMNGQHTITELAVMVMMGAIIALPMGAPDRGIVQGIVILLVILALLRGLTWLSFKHPSFQKSLQGDVILLVRDGELQLDVMKDYRISRQQVYALLRTRDVLHLGRVKRLYLESSGRFSLYQQPDAQPGLPVTPPTDNDLLATLEKAEQQACCSCGHLRPPSDPDLICTRCGGGEWTPAIS